MINLSEMISMLEPSRTVLFLGAGASVTSGAPLAQELALQLARAVTGKADGVPQSTDLMELSGLLEMKYGRDKLIGALRKILTPLAPSGGILGLPMFPWAAIYSTNYDTLVEHAYRQARVRLAVVRSNYEYNLIDDAVPLFKIHGSIEEDIADGRRGRIVLTERDYDEYASFRQVLFSKLQLDLATKNVLILGHSLRDAHLREMVKRAVDLKRSAGAPGKVYLVVYDRDEDRAALIESLGVVVAFGDVDSVGVALADRAEATESPAPGASDPHRDLPISVAARVIDAAQAITQSADAERLYAGAPATYADVQAGFTFARSCEHRLLEALRGDKHCVALVGVAGAGKTTISRRLGCVAVRAGLKVWELRFGAPLNAKAWIDVAKSMADGERAILIIDDCTNQQRQVNLLIDGLADLPNPPLRLVIVAQTSQWAPRTKTPRLFRFGLVEHVGPLAEQELDALLDLIDSQPSLQRLVERGFLEKGRPQRLQALRSRCSGDMFVALKYLFSTDALDTILLREYAELNDDVQDIYRVVAGLEAAGARVHRQLVIRLLGVRSDLLAGYLAILNGLVEEFDIAADEGIYGWRTRHEVVAQTIARYKLADQSMLHRLLVDMIDAINPTVYVERATVSAICQSEFGIRRIENDAARRALLERLIAQAPSERVPRHRLVRELLDCGSLTEAELAIVDAERTVGADGPLRRYKVLHAVARAVHTQGILTEDRMALLAEARRMAVSAIELSPEDRHTYMTLVRVAEARFQISGDRDWLDEALVRLRVGVSRTLDPELVKALRDLEHRRLPRRSVDEPE